MAAVYGHVGPFDENIETSRFVAGKVATNGDAVDFFSE